VRQAAGATDVIGRLIASLPTDFGRWPFLCQDQYLEVKTLLGGYLLSSQGDRMLMAHSVEGRFPFLDADVVELANSLPPSYLLRASTRSTSSSGRPRGHPRCHRAPEEAALPGARRPGLRRRRGTRLGRRGDGRGGRGRRRRLRARAVAQLWRKCQAAGGAGQFSNADNMAVVGVLSTGLLHQALVRGIAPRRPALPFKTLVDRWPGAPNGSGNSPSQEARS